MSSPAYSKPSLPATVCIRNFSVLLKIVLVLVTYPKNHALVCIHISRSMVTVFRVTELNIPTVGACQTWCIFSIRNSHFLPSITSINVSNWTAVIHRSRDNSHSKHYQKKRCDTKCH